LSASSRPAPLRAYPALHGSARRRGPGCERSEHRRSRLGLDGGEHAGRIKAAREEGLSWSVRAAPRLVLQPGEFSLHHSGEAGSPSPIPAKPVHPSPIPAKPVHPSPNPAKPVHPSPIPAKPVHPSPNPAKPVHPSPNPAKPVHPPRSRSRRPGSGTKASAIKLQVGSPPPCSGLRVRQRAARPRARGAASVRERVRVYKRDEAPVPLGAGASSLAFYGCYITRRQRRRDPRAAPA
jgi:hypothetical protein